MMYDPATSQWISKATVPQPRSGVGAALGGKLYLIGGGTLLPDGTWKEFRTTSAYDPTTDTWMDKAPMPTLRPGVSFIRVVLGGQARIELVGGTRPATTWPISPSRATTPGFVLRAPGLKSGLT
jgi:hypothetical protein